MRNLELGEAIHASGSCPLKCQDILLATPRRYTEIQNSGQAMNETHNLRTTHFGNLDDLEPSLLRPGFHQLRVDC